MNKWTRRTFIGAGTIAGGGFLLGVAGFALAPARHAVVDPAGAGPGQLTTWIRINADGRITILVPHCDMGQGTLSALGMMAADELDADWTQVDVIEAPGVDTYANGYLARTITGDHVPAVMARGFDYGMYKVADWVGLMVTGGSTAVRSTGEFGMRVAGAAARQMLVEAAAQQWGVAASECQASASVVRHAASGRQATYGQLAEAASHLKVPTAPTLKGPDAFSLRRTSAPRLDIASKVNGRATYGIDVSLPGMLYAAVDIAPVQGGTLQSVDPAPAMAMRGVKKVVSLPNAVAVVADSYWRARQALAALQPVYTDAGHGQASSTSIFAAFDAAIGPLPEMPADATRVVRAEYRVPFLAHASMEPLSCTAQVDDTGARIWAGVQDPLNARTVAAKALGIDRDRVQLTNHLLGGSFGRRLPYSFDYIELGVQVAQQMSPTPVKTIWSRETDMQHDYYRPAALSRHAASLDASGRPIIVRSAFTGDGDGEALAMPYAIGKTESTQQESAHHVRLGAWRSVASSQHGFFKESFMDELAHEAKADPYDYRRGLLSASPRALAVLERAAALAGWGTPLPEGEGRGIALCDSFGSIVAEVAHVRVDSAGVLRVLAVDAVVDCGDVISPDGATAQVEGGILFGLSAALMSAITIEQGRVVQTNFRDYPMPRIKDTPRIRVEFVRSDAPLGGLGEPAVPPIAPAVANAIFAATGVRVRALPFTQTPLRKA